MCLNFILFYSILFIEIRHLIDIYFICDKTHLISLFDTAEFFIVLISYAESNS